MVDDTIPPVSQLLTRTHQLQVIPATYRRVEAVVSAEMADLVRDITLRDILYDGIETVLAEQGRIIMSYNHEDTIVGEWNEFKKIDIVDDTKPENEQVTIPAIWGAGKVYEGTSYQDKVWNEIQTGKILGVSVASETAKRYVYNNNHTYRILDTKRVWAITLGDQPMIPVTYIIKASLAKKLLGDAELETKCRDASMCGSDANMVSLCHTLNGKLNSFVHNNHDNHESFLNHYNRNSTIKMSTIQDNEQLNQKIDSIINSRLEQMTRAEETKKLNTMLESITGSLQSLETERAKLNDESAGITKLKNEIDTKSAELDERSTKLDNLVTELDTKSKKLDEQSKKLDERSAKMDEESSKMSDEMKKMKEDMKKLEEEKEKLAKMVDDSKKGDDNGNGDGNGDDGDDSKKTQKTQKTVPTNPPTDPSLDGLPEAPSDPDNAIYLPGYEPNEMFTVARKLNNQYGQKLARQMFLEQMNSGRFDHLVGIDAAGKQKMAPHLGGRY